LVTNLNAEMLNGRTSNFYTSATNISTGTLGVGVGGTGVNTLATDKLVVGNGTSAVRTPANLHWDNTNFRLGVGSSSPTTDLDVTGTIRASSAMSAQTYTSTAGIGTAPFSVTSTTLVSNLNAEMLNGRTSNFYTSATNISSGTLGVGVGGTGVNTLAANKVVVGNGTSAVRTPTNLHWDNTNFRLGVGSSAPTTDLDVLGSINFTGQLTSNGVPFVSGSGSSSTGAGGWDVRTSTSVATYSNVGIGTTPNSAYLLHLYTASNIAYIDRSGNISTIGDITGFDSLSDARLKDNVVQLNEAECLTKIRAIRPVEFDWNSNVSNSERIGQHDIGVIAQELEEIFPEAVREKEYFHASMGGTVKTVKYEKIIPLLIGAVKELKTSLNTVTELYSNLASRVATLER
jgi:hypothetical protein